MYMCMCVGLVLAVIHVMIFTVNHPGHEYQLRSTKETQTVNVAWISVCVLPGLFLTGHSLYSLKAMFTR